ncbi:MAG: OprO/OprP family phosphate-selective porin [Acidobacteriota bacterium]|nr:OprO/OprP family phosphate-selective porin [Acidobacteriota bacterium]
MGLKRLAFILASFGSALTPAIHAQQTSEQDKIVELQRKIEELDRRLAAAEARSQPASAKPAKPAADAGRASETSNAGIVTAGPGGFVIRSTDGDYTLKIGADLQADIRTFTGTGSGPLNDQILLRRIRPTLSGTLYKKIDYYIRPDFGQGTVVVSDAYVQLNYIPRFSIRVGKFKPPVGLERLQSDDDGTFIERGLPTLLAPSRDIGFQLSGDLISRRLGYQVGVFNGVPDNSLSDVSPSGHRSYAARLFATPFASGRQNVLSGLGFGVAAEGGNTDGVGLPAYKTAGQNTFFTFSSGVISAGHRTVLAPQAYYYLGPFGLLAEYTVAEEEFQKNAVRRNVAFRSWQVEASYVLTGEKKSFGGVTPRRPFAPFDHGWGAWELAVRTGDFRIDRGLFNYGFASATASPSFAREWVGGVNWYLNRVFKISADYAHTNFVGGAVGANRASERAILTRFQLNFL